MLNILIQIHNLVKGIGSENMNTLFQSRWIRFAIGFILICYGISLIKWW